MSQWGALGVPFAWILGCTGGKCCFHPSFWSHAHLQVRASRLSFWCDQRDLGKSFSAQVTNCPALAGAVIFSARPHTLSLCSFPGVRLPREGVVFLNDLRGSNIFYRKCPQMHVVILCLRQTRLRLAFFLSRADGAPPEHTAPISARAWGSQFYPLNMQRFSPILLLSKASSLCENVFVKNLNFEAYRDWNT